MQLLSCDEGHHPADAGSTSASGDEITPTLRELPSLQLAAVHAALYQTLAAQIQAACHALLANQPDDQAPPIISIPPERIAAAAQLLSESPALNAAVSLLALGNAGVAATPA